MSDGTGASYSPNDPLTMPATPVTLYAQWYYSGILVTFDLGGQGLSFSPSAVSIAAGSTIVIGCGNLTLSTHGSNWRWYVDGAEPPASTTAGFNYHPADIGQHIISCLVDYDGTSYSGQFRATVK